MNIHIKALHVIAISGAAVLTACGGSSSSTYVTPAGGSAANSHSVQSQTLAMAQRAGDFVISGVRAANARPATGANGIIDVFTTVSPSNSATPCFTCVNSPGISGSFGMMAATPFLDHTSSGTYQYLMYFQDASQSGTCKVAITLKQGTVSKKYSGSAKLMPGLWQASVNDVLPAGFVAGAATITSKVTCGAASSSLTSQLYFS